MNPMTNSRARTCVHVQRSIRAHVRTPTAHFSNIVFSCFSCMCAYMWLFCVTLVLCLMSVLGGACNAWYRECHMHGYAGSCVRWNVHASEQWCMHQCTSKGTRADTLTHPKRQTRRQAPVCNHACNLRTCMHTRPRQHTHVHPPHQGSQYPGRDHC